MNAIVAISWQPELRGILVVLIAAAVLIGSTYLILSTNLGARLGFLVAFAALFGWLATMGSVWWAYGIGLKGREPTWKPAAPVTLVETPEALTSAQVLVGGVDVPFGVSTSQEAVATLNDNADSALESEGWAKLPESSSTRGQAGSAADEILVNEFQRFADTGAYRLVNVYDKGGKRYPVLLNGKVDFFAFFHKPHYALVEIEVLTPLRDEPGRAPTRAETDPRQPHKYVLMIRDLGTKRQPAAVITIGSGLIFVTLCFVLHRRDRVVTLHRSGAVVAAGS